MCCAYHKVSSFKPVYFIRRLIHPLSGKKRNDYVLNSPLLTKRYKFIPLQKDLNNLRNIPVFIISYNRLSYVKQMVERLQKYGMKNIHIIDNKSSYPPLLKYLKNCPATVHYMDRNYGHMVFWQSHKFDNIIRRSVYIVSDPDIEINDNLPDNWLEQMYRLLGEYRNITKVGFALRIDDLPVRAENIKDYETQYWKKAIPHEGLELYHALIDTTFAMYRPGIIHGTGHRFLSGIRIAGDFTALHLPWYIDPTQESDEDKYYRAHADTKISNWANSYKKVTNDPLISVIITVHNTNPQYIKEAIDSVCAQTFRRIEIIVVNDGSTAPDTLSYLDTLKGSTIRVLTQKNAGVIAARTNGINAAKSEYVFMLDDDDRIAPLTLEKMYSAIQQPGRDIITCRVMLFGEKTGEMILLKPNKINMANQNCLVNAALIRKSDFIACGGFDARFSAMLEDYDLWLNMLYNHNKKIYRIPEMLFFYRIKPEIFSRNQQKRDTEYDKTMNLLHQKYPLRRWHRIGNVLSYPSRVARLFFRVHDNRIKIFTIPVYKVKNIKSRSI